MIDDRPSRPTWTEPPPITPTDGQRVGRYELCFELATGGTATVYLARTDAIGGFRKLVALKVIHPHLGRERNFVDMFLDEARLVARLHHPNVGTVIDVGEADGSYYMAMEYVLGETANGLMRIVARDFDRYRRELPALAAKIVADACDGLHAAHELCGATGEPLGVVHRDVSPQNILIGYDGSVRVIDFGIAKAAGRLQHTRPGVVKGKFAYMSPEQLTGGEVDRRTDVWALGIVLWELATGQRLFRSATEAETVLAVQCDEIRKPSSVNRAVPASFDAICMRALDRDADGRHPTAREVSRELRRFLATTGTGDAPGLEQVAAFMARACGDLRMRKEALVESARTMEIPEGDDRISKTLVTAALAPPSDAGMRIETNLAPDPSSFIGREREIGEVGELLASGARVVTLIGPPGIGKTRLAVRCAEERLALGLGSVWHVDVTEARTIEDICAAVFEAVGVQPPPGANTEDVIAYISRALGQRKQPLVLFDNFEHLVELAPDTVGRWVRSAPSLQLIVTSRERLRVAGERVLDVAPLTAEVDAVRLLLDRAAGYEPSPADLPLLDEIVRALEGIPLAIELAATALPLLGPRRLLERMSDRLDVLSRGPRGKSDRQATLHGAIEWSWSLLEPWEQTALAQCSVFRGGFAPETAEALVDLSAHPDAPSVLEVLAALKDKSLLRSQAIPEHPGETRLRLYTTVREYAAARLADAGSAAQVIRRHTECYAELGTRWLDRLHGERGIEALTRLGLERDNLLAAANATLADSPPDARLLFALDALLSTRGPFDRHLDLLDRGLEALERAPAFLRSSLHLARARALRQRGRTAESQRDLDRAIAIAEGGDLRFFARLELERAELHQAQGNMADARTALDRALDLLADSEDDGTRGRIERAIGLLHHSQGQLDAAWERYASAQRLFRRLGDVTAEATVLHHFGSLRLQQGRLDEARAHYETALALERQIGDTRIVGSILGNLGILEQEIGNLQKARERYEEALRCVREVGDRTLEGHLLGYLAGLALEEGTIDEANTWFTEAISLLREIGDKRLEGLFLAMKGVVDSRLAREGAALEAFSASERLLGDVGDPGLLGALALHRGHLALARHRALRSSAPDEAAAAWREAHDALDRAGDDDASLRAASDDYRFAERVLRRALSEGTLLVAEDASWLELPNGERVDLSARQPLRRVVECLVARRLAAPGENVSVDDLVAAGWPDERILASAAGNRIGVALTSLRKLGLREILLREGDGYRLDPVVPVARGK